MTTFAYDSQIQERYPAVAGGILTAHGLKNGPTPEPLREAFLANLRAIDTSAFADKRVVVKGCGDLQVDGFAYLEIARRLRPVVKSIMYGEACSNVPVYKKK